MNEQDYGLGQGQQGPQGQGQPYNNQNQNQGTNTGNIPLMGDMNNMYGGRGMGGMNGMGMGGMNGAGGMNSMNGAGGMNMQTGGMAPNVMLWIVLGAVQALFICCCNVLSFLAGVATIILACMANTAFNTGNMKGYQDNIKYAKIVNIAGWVLMVLGFILNIVFGLFDLITSLF